MPRKEEKPRTEPKQRYVFRRVERVALPFSPPTQEELENDDVEGYQKRVINRFMEQQERESDPIYLLAILKDRALIELQNLIPEFPDQFSEKDLYSLFKRKENEDLEAFQDKDNEQLDLAVDALLAIMKAELLLQDANEDARELAVELLRAAHGFGDTLLRNYEPAIWQGTTTLKALEIARTEKKRSEEEHRKSVLKFYRSTEFPGRSHRSRVQMTMDETGLSQAQVYKIIQSDQQLRRTKKRKRR